MHRRDWDSILLEEEAEVVAEERSSLLGGKHSQLGLGSREDPEIGREGGEGCQSGGRGSNTEPELMLMLEQRGNGAPSTPHGGRKRHWKREREREERKKGTS